MSTPRRSWPRSRGAPMMAMWECRMTLFLRARRHGRVYRTVGLGGRASRRGSAFRSTFRNITRVLAERGATATVLGGSAAGARLGSDCPVHPVVNMPRLRRIAKSS